MLQLGKKLLLLNVQIPRFLRLQLFVSSASLLQETPYPLTT
jgi:hypothetical protein